MGDRPMSSDAPVDAGQCPTGAEAPEARGDGAGAVDPMTGALYLFGGDVGMTRNCMQTPAFRDDTWRYDPRCDHWDRLAMGATAPSARSRSAFALDSRRRRLIVFGGRYRAGTSGAYTLLQDTWALDLASGAWTQIEATGGPSARANATAVYDREGDAFVVFGGNTNTNGAAFTPRRDTFVLDLATNTWRQIAADGAPPARLFHAAAMQGRVMWIASGGDANAFTGPFLRDVWTLDLSTEQWRRVTLSGDTAALVGRINHVLVPAPTGGGVVVLGGHDDGALGNRNDVISIAPDGTVRTVRGGDTLRHAGSGFCNFPADFTMTDMDAPERRSAFVGAVEGGGARAVVYGGKTDCGLAGDVWAVDLASGAWSPLRSTNEGLSCARTGRTGCQSLCL